MSIKAEIIILCVLMAMMAASIIIKLVLRSKLKGMDGFDGVVKHSVCKGNVIGSVIGGSKENIK